ncbi:putative late blight resistance protein homolog R1B-16 [Lycium ferocissimum]|uniref:putative late blight resistance protein homolog R1B-16 n=1 Tax=Lycium ferocissimum TaxID=112874 RepID=UPI002814AE2B|nr:putative late blight resistance protein homolog R1B-16 [Lycium ferocissimum]
MDRIKKIRTELKFLRSLICFVSDRCIGTHSQHTFFTHVLVVARQTAMLAWLLLPGHEQLVPGEMDDLPSDLEKRIHPIESCICNIYVGVLQDLNPVQSPWYPVIRIDYVVDCQVRFLETLLHHLEGIPTIAIKANLQEMLDILRANFIDLAVQEIGFPLQDIDSVIVDAGLLVYLLNDNEKDKEVMYLKDKVQRLILDIHGNIQSMQALIYIHTRKSFLLQCNLTSISRQCFTDFNLDNLKELLSHYSDSLAPFKNPLQTIQKETKYFQAVVEQKDGLQRIASEVIGLVYEVEYMFDSYMKKAVPDWCLFLWILHIAREIRLLMTEVEEVQEMDASDLVFYSTGDASGAHTYSKSASDASIHDEMVGFEDVMDEVRDKLTEGSSCLDVISIVGMPGIGKTTLANKSYFNQSVVSHFDIRAQCCVSQEYTRKDLLLAILGDIIGETDKLDREADDVLADQLRKHLLRTRYLIFIDDIWDTSAWDDLRLCFPNANNGSRIILMTRHYDVASYAKHVSDPLVLRFLSNDESWMLLQIKVFNRESFPLVLTDVGKRIAQKCGGLPLSIVLVAGILTRMEKKTHCWEQVATNLGTHIQAQAEDTISPSYQILPHHLKTCFLYFGVFSEDQEIQVSKLTWLWISEGFVKTHTEKLLEDIAKDYLENLVERNLVMVAKRSSDGKIKARRSHDLLLEFCREKAKLENFVERIKGDKSMDSSHIFPPQYKTPRRISLYSRCNSVGSWCFSYSHVKSFQFRESRKIAFSSIDHASYIFRRFKFLRVLDLEFTIIDSFPQELTFLRYLAARTAEQFILFPSNLLNLETLILQGIRGRVSLPNTIWTMVKLRHLHIYDQAFFTLGNGKELLESPSKMYDLQTLSSACFSCVDNADKILTKTPNLQKLRCEVLKFDGSFPAFNNLTKVEMLKISSGPTLTWINQLKFPSNLKKLTLSNFRIHLNAVSTPPKLEVLKLLGVTISSNTREVNDEQLLQLKFLKLENPSFSEWDVSDDAFPRLKHLVLKRCRHLKAVPSRFGDMPSLKSIEVKSCHEWLAESAMVIQRTQVEEMGYSDFQVLIHK